MLLKVFLLYLPLYFYFWKVITIWIPIMTWIFFVYIMFFFQEFRECWIGSGKDLVFTLFQLWVIERLGSCGLLAV